MKAKPSVLRSPRRAPSKALRAPAATEIPKTGPLIEMVPAVLGIDHILVPIDFSRTSVEALRYAVPLARQFGAKLTLFYAIEPPPYGPELSFPAVNLTATKIAAREKLTKLANRAIPKEVKCRVEVRCGPAYECAIEAARERGVDLIVLTTHGYTGLKHVLMGSTAERVVRHAPCPVLVVR